MAKAKAKAPANAKALAKKKAGAKKTPARGKAKAKGKAPAKKKAAAGAKKAPAPKKAPVVVKGGPLATAKARFGKDGAKDAKEALVAAVRDLAGKDLWVDALNEDKGLERVSNRKLLHLYDVFTAVKAKFASRKALIEAIAEAKKRKDEAFRAKLEGQTTARLWDAYRVTSKP
jgi:hypothetical protein